MDIGNPPEIVIQHVERHNIREEEIERVARLLARADGKDPDEDTSCVTVEGAEYKHCFVFTNPIPRVWHRYRDQAEKLLAQIFAPEISTNARGNLEIPPGMLPPDLYMARPPSLLSPGPLLDDRTSQPIDPYMARPVK